LKAIEASVCGLISPRAGSVAGLSNIIEVSSQSSFAGEISRPIDENTGEFVLSEDPVLIGESIETSCRPVGVSPVEGEGGCIHVKSRKTFEAMLS